MLCRNFPVLSCSSAYFEEGSICMIDNEECSSSDFSSHPLSKNRISLLFAAVRYMCSSLNLPWSCLPLLEISRKFLKLPMKLSMGGDFCPSCHLGFFVEWFEPTDPRWRQVPQREDILFLWKKKTHLVSQCHLPRRWRCGFSVCRYTWSIEDFCKH